MAILLHVSEDTRWTNSAGKIRGMEDSEDEFSDVDPSSLPDMTITPELDMLCLPSSLAAGEIHRKSLESVAIVEAELRRAQKMIPSIDFDWHSERRRCRSGRMSAMRIANAHHSVLGPPFINTIRMLGNIGIHIITPEPLLSVSTAFRNSWPLSAISRNRI
jgi:hypothetical protein